MDQQNYSGSLQNVVVSVVNPQGTVTTVTNNAIQQEESYTTEIFIHENLDETMFRPVITVMSDPDQQGFPDYDLGVENASDIVDMPSELVVPVIDEALFEQRKRDLDSRKKRSESEPIEPEINTRNFDSEPLEAMPLDLKTVADGVKVQATERPQDSQTNQKRGKKGSRNKKNDTEKKFTEKIQKEPELGKVVLTKSEEGASVEKSARSHRTSIKEASIEKDMPSRIISDESQKYFTKKNVEKSSSDNSTEERKAAESSNESSVENVMPQDISIGKAKSLERNTKSVKTSNDENIAVLNEALSEMKLESETAGSTTQLPFILGAEPEGMRTPEQKQEKQTLLKVSPDEASWEKVKITSTADDKQMEPFVKKGKKSKKIDNDAKHGFGRGTKSDDDFPSLIAQNPPQLIAIETTPFEEISQPQFGDDEIEIIPHERTAEDSGNSDPDANLIDENLIQSQDFTKDGQQEFIKNEDFYDIDEDLPPLEPLEQFEPFNTPTNTTSSSESVCQKQAMKQKMSELLKDTNIVFAMCSSLKEIKEDSDVMSSSSQIQRSTSSSLTTNTTTATFASANSHTSFEGQDIDDSSPVEPFAALSKIKTSTEEGDETSGFETTSSETDESSKKSNVVEPAFKREDDEELRPLLLESSITSLSPSGSSSATLNATDANNIPTLPDTNQKLSQTQTASSNNNTGNKRKNKKKRK